MADASLIAIASPVAFSFATLSAVHSGSSPVVGPGTSDLARDTESSRLLMAPGRGGLIPMSPPPTSPPRVASSVLGAVLSDASGGYRWSASTGGARAASANELASGTAVIGIGGYKGTDPAPSLSEFEQLIEDGDIHYFFAGWTAGSDLSAIESWVSPRFPSDTIDGNVVYDLTARLSPK